MERLRRSRLRRPGPLGIVLLILLVLLVAHLLIMGTNHHEQAACASCVVVVITGALAALMHLVAVRHSADSTLRLSIVSSARIVVLRHRGGDPPGRFALRL